MDEKTVRDLQDKAAIVDVINLYSTALDTKNWDLLESTFTADGGAFFDVMGIGDLETPQDVVAISRSSLENLKATQHLLGNYVIEISGDTATAVTYIQAGHFAEGCPGGDSLTAWANLEDDLVRTEVGWRIKHRRLLPFHMEGNFALFAEAAELADKTAAAATE